MDLYELKIVQFFVDLKNFFKFKKEISHEISLRDSKFNKFELKRNWLGNIVYVQLNFSDTELMGVDYNENALIQTKLKPIVSYLSSELGWGDYLTLQISNFVDEEGNPTLSYGVLFIFTGYVLTLTKLFWWTICLFAVLGTGIWAIIKYLI